MNILILCGAIGCTSLSAASNTAEILKVTVGEPTKLSTVVYQNASTLLVSRTGAVAVIYVKPGRTPRYPEKTLRGMAMGYRVSTDGGITWGEEMIAPDEFEGGQVSGMMPNGGVYKPTSGPRRSTDYTRAKGWRGDADPSENPKGLRKDWYDLKYLIFADDLMSWQGKTARVYQPRGQKKFRGEGGFGFALGKITYLPDGAMLAPMNAGLIGDPVESAIITKSTDQGRTWRYFSTIYYNANNPNPEFPGHYAGANEPCFTLLPDGRMLAILRMQYSQFAGEYLPLYTTWSSDQGKTWTKPKPTEPQLMCTSPKVEVLDNGVVACEYGRPGFHVAFSLDNGRTWQDRVSLSTLPVNVITGQFDMVKAGPNRLVVVGNDGEGTKVWPITVERVTVTPASTTLTGRVTDDQGNPIAGAKVERSPNRYVAESWQEGDTLNRTKSAFATVGSPKLSYFSIQKKNGYPTVKTNKQGQFQFKAVGLVEYVLTVESPGFAPQFRHINVTPDLQPQDFSLKPGQSIRGRVVDDEGKGVLGACVVRDKWHTHTDKNGYFHWSLEAPIPSEVTVKIFKKYKPYGSLTETILLPQIAKKSFVLPRLK